MSVAWSDHVPDFISQPIVDFSVRQTTDISDVDMVNLPFQPPMELI